MSVQVLLPSIVNNNLLFKPGLIKLMIWTLVVQNKLTHIAVNITWKDFVSLKFV